VINEVLEIINKEFEEVYSSSLSLKLLNIYSKIYLDGAQPNYCKAAQQSYYNLLQSEGLQKAKIMDEILKSTHKTNVKGLMYIGKPFCRHFDLENLTDKQATDLLQSGWLKENQFDKLPELYKEEKKIEDEIKKEEKKAKAKK